MPLPPLRFTSRGIEACNLGDGKADILKRWKIDSKQTTPDGALFFGQPDASPYDMILVAAAPREVPPALVEQLAEGGRMAIPVAFSADELDKHIDPFIGRQADSDPRAGPAVKPIDGSPDRARRRHLHGHRSGFAAARATVLPY